MALHAHVASCLSPRRHSKPYFCFVLVITCSSSLTHSWYMGCGYKCLQAVADIDGCGSSAHVGAAHKPGDCYCAGCSAGMKSSVRFWVRSFKALWECSKGGPVCTHWTMSVPVYHCIEMSTSISWNATFLVLRLGATWLCMYCELNVEVCAVWFHWNLQW